MEWKNTDPRFDMKRYGAIIILRPNLGCGWDVGVGEVYTDDSWVIYTSFADHPKIKADENWDAIWLWVYQPNR